MKYLFICFFLIHSCFSFASEKDYSGTWQGVLIKAGQSIEDGTILYADFKIVDGIVTGYMRQEVYESDYFGLKQLKGTLEKDALFFNQTVVEKHNSVPRTRQCLNKGELKYDPITGYLKGTFESTDCSRLMGEIILYQSDFELSKNDSSHSSHIWFQYFIRDYKDGLSAPKIREIERKNFVFEPIFFDFDKSEIRDEHKEFLDRMIKVVKGHSDLRVLVTGHTDAIGSNGYNEGLSKRRAEAIVKYFEAHGLTEDHLKFDFKGETNPTATNDTSEGRQKNRRVDFKFI